MCIVCESLILQHIDMYNTKVSSREIIGNLKMQEVMWELLGRTVGNGDTVPQGVSH